MGNATSEPELAVDWTPYSTTPPIRFGCIMLPPDYYHIRPQPNDPYPPGPAVLQNQMQMLRRYL